MGSIADHFRSFTAKQQPVQIPGIDFIYLINLDRRPDRLTRSLAQFQQYGLIFHRFPAIYGWDFSQETFNDIGLQFKKPMDFSFDRQVFFGLKTTEDVPEKLDESSYGRTCVHQTTSGGSLGGSLSHLSVLQHAYDSGFKTVWILEDDFTIQTDPRCLTSMLSNLPSGWDLLYTDDDHCLGATGTQRVRIRPDLPPASHTFEHTPVPGGFFKIGGRYQLHSVVFNRSGIEKVLNHIKKGGLFRTFDVEINFVPNIQMYNSSKSIVHGRDRMYSDTERKLF